MHHALSKRVAYFYGAFVLVTAVASDMGSTVYRDTIIISLGWRITAPKGLVG